MKQTKLFLSLLMLLVFSIGNVWGETASVGDILWAENFAHFSNDDAPSKAGTGSGTTIFGGATITYTETNGKGTTKAYSEVLAGGTAPELLLAKSNGTWTISGIPTGGATEMKLTFKSNKTTFSLTTKSSDLTISGSQTSWTIKVAESKSVPTTFDLTITNTSTTNARIDDVSLVVKTAGDKEIASLIVVSPGALTFADNTLSNGSAVGEATLTVIGKNLTEGISVTFKDNKKSIFSITPTLSADGGTIAVEYMTGTRGDYSATLVLSSAGAADVEVPLSVKIAAEPAKLTSIAIDATNAKTTYTEGETFSTEGLTVTGTYSDATTETITEGIIWSYYPINPLKTTDTKVTISATVESIVSDAIEILISVTTAPQVADFIFNTDDGLTALGITKPAKSKGTNLGTSSYVSKVITMTTTDGSTPTRVWNSQGNTNLRVYKPTGSLTFTTTDGYAIASVVFDGNVYFDNPSVGSLSDKKWIEDGKHQTQSITFVATDGCNINSIKVTYINATPKIDPVITCKEILDLTNETIDITPFSATFERTEMVTVDLFTDAECTTKFTDSWFQVKVAEEAPFTISYLADENTDAERTIYMKIEAINGTSGSVAAQKVVTVTQAKGIPTFASLEELAAADIASGTMVRVSFTNTIIKDFYTTTNGYTNGVFFDIQKDGKDIEIYYFNVPDTWEKGGKLSGTMTCPWEQYNGTWELVPEKNSWDWNSLTYTEPAAFDHIVISGEATKVEYTEGDIFAPTGLVVKAVDTENGETDITASVDWSYAPAVLALGTTSVKATATYNGKTTDVTVSVTVNAMSEEYTFASLEDLVAADVPTGTIVKVSLSNVEIKKLAKSGTYINGVYFDIQKEEKDIEIYYKDVPAEWEVGGSLSGTIVAPWVRYSDKNNVFVCWELAPVAGSWAWTELTYTPAPKIVSIAISGTAHTTYTEGDLFSTEGLTITAALDNNTTKDVTNDITWEITPATALTTATTSVSVKAILGEIESEPMNINITVQEKQMEGDPIVIAFEYSGSYYALKTDLTVYSFPEGAGVVAGKMVNIPEADRANITWYRANVAEGVTFQNKKGEYLNVPNSPKTNIGVSTSPCTWIWNEIGYYTTGDARTLLYQKEANAIKNYAASNVNTSTKNASYSGFAMYLSEYIDGEIADVRELNGNIGTLCLEKKVIAFDGAKFYRIHSKDAATSALVKNVTFEEITEMLEAGEACIFEPEDGASQIRVVYTGDAVSAPLAGKGLTGTFSTLNPLKGNVEGNFADIFFVINNKIHKAGDDAKLAPNRAYINMHQVAYNAPRQAGRRYIILGNGDSGTATGIDDMTDTNVIRGTYDVLGRKIGDTSAAGLHIVDGKKVLIVK